MAHGYPDYRFWSIPALVAEGGTGLTTLTLNGVLLGNTGSPVQVTAAGAADEVFRVPGAGGAPAFGALDLAAAATFTGTLSLAHGGTASATGYIHQLNLGSGMNFKFTPNEATSKDFNWVLYDSPNVGDTRHNWVMRWGWNVAANGSLESAGDSALYFHLEEHYAPDANRWTEAYLNYVDTANNIFHFFGMAARKADNWTVGSIRFDWFSWQRRTDDAQWMVFTDNKIDLVAAQIYQNTNNHAWLNQSNAAASGAVEIARVNASDQVVLAPGGAVLIAQGTLKGPGGGGLQVGNTGSVAYIGDGTAGVDVQMRGAAGTSRQFMYASGASIRWDLRVTSGAESGGNAGSDWGLYRYTDAGAQIDAAIYVSRASGAITLAAPLPVASGGSGTATPALVAGTGITISGSWPNQTVGLTTPVTVANGGTGTITGSITGTGELTFQAGGSNQNVRLWPSGSGTVAIGITGSVCTIGDGTGAVDAQLRGAAGTSRQFFISTVASPRWEFRATAEAESGSNAGSNFGLYRYSDAGASLGVALSIVRSTGVTTFGAKVIATQLESNVATGTAPFVVASTTEVANLNADRVGGTEVTDAAAAGELLVGTGAGTAAWGTPDGCRVYNNADLTIANNTITKLTFNSERWDDGGLHSTASNTSRITIVTAGKYLLGADVYWANDVLGYRSMRLRLNNTTTIAAASCAPSYWNGTAPTALPTHMQIHTIYDLAVADYVELDVYQNCGGNLAVSYLANESPEFWAQWLGP